MPHAFMRLKMNQSSHSGMNVSQNIPNVNSNLLTPVNSNASSQTLALGSNGDQSNKVFPSKHRICWDYVRNNCRRKNCRFPHVLSPDLIIFCHDYQNTSCPRANCKFLHYSLQEEEYYRKFGEFPQFEGGSSNGGSGPKAGMASKEQAPYPQGFKRCELNSVNGGRSCFDGFNWSSHSPICQSNDILSSPINVFHHCDEFQAMKRTPREAVDSIVDSTIKRFREDNDRMDVMQVIRRFEEEQAILRRRVEANEIRIAELRASNEYLMAQIRLNNQQCSGIVNPVTVTQTTSQPGSQSAAQVIGGVSIAPVQVQATPIVSIATHQPQIIAANSGAPLAIAAANTSQGQQQIAIAAQQNITSLTSTSQPLQTAHAQQILGTSQITLTPVAPPPSMGLAINTSQATLAMSNSAPQPIISYPVMTHSILPH